MDIPVVKHKKDKQTDGHAARLQSPPDEGYKKIEDS